jgi:hypothetical protein
VTAGGAVDDFEVGELIDDAVGSHLAKCS